MNTPQILDQAGKPVRRQLGMEVASHTTDPAFYSAMEILPNPDEVLRKMGCRQQVFRSILADGHVMGEVRSMRGNLFSYQYDLVAGGTDPADLEAQALCRQVMLAEPSQYTTFDDIIWTAYSAVLFGNRVAEVVWDTSEQWLPRMIREVPDRRVRFDYDHGVRILTRSDTWRGEQPDPRQILVWRHMPSRDNPYGEALLSRCFWPCVFKRGGWKYFVKFCERFGIPWTIGKVPPGTQQKQKNDMLGQLRQMIESAIAVLEDDGSVELLDKAGGGEPVQAKLIQLCDREISKVLTSQTQATELGKEGGSRAASETHASRQADGNTADRRMVTAGFQCLWNLVTEFNVPGAAPPKLGWRKVRVTPVANPDEVRSLNEIIPLSRSWVREQFNARVPEDADDTIEVGSLRPLPGADVRANAAQPPAQGDGPNDPRGDQGKQFSRAFEAHTGRRLHSDAEATAAATDRAAQAADAIIARDLIDPIDLLLADFEKAGRPLAELPDALAALYPALDDSALARLTATASEAVVLGGMDAGV